MTSPYDKLANEVRCHLMGLETLARKREDPAAQFILDDVLRSAEHLKARLEKNDELRRLSEAVEFAFENLSAEKYEAALRKYSQAAMEDLHDD